MPQQSLVQSVKNTYNAIGKEFSSSRRYIWQDLRPFIDKVKHGSSVLDVGCGNGRLLLGLPENIKYTGMDISQNLLNEAEKTHSGHKFIEADITKLSVWKNLPQFDYILCVAVFHHLPTQKDQLFVLNQIRRHLKPNGKVLITAWNLWQPKFLKHHLSLKSLNVKCKMLNVKYLYVPFQSTPRFCYAVTIPYLRRLLHLTNFRLRIKKSPNNYLLFS